MTLGQAGNVIMDYFSSSYNIVLTQFATAAGSLLQDLWGNVVTLGPCVTHAAQEQTQSTLF